MHLLGCGRQQAQHDRVARVRFEHLGVGVTVGHAAQRKVGWARSAVRVGMERLGTQVERTPRQRVPVVHEQDVLTETAFEAWHDLARVVDVRNRPASDLFAGLRVLVRCTCGFRNECPEEPVTPPVQSVDVVVEVDRSVLASHEPAILHELDADKFVARVCVAQRSGEHDLVAIDLLDLRGFEDLVELIDADNDRRSGMER